jgi:hypothetical protein
MVLTVRQLSEKVGVWLSCLMLPRMHRSEGIAGRQVFRARQGDVVVGLLVTGNYCRLCGLHKSPIGSWQYSAKLWIDWAEALIEASSTFGKSTLELLTQGLRSYLISWLHEPSR